MSTDRTATSRRFTLVLLSLLLVAGPLLTVLPTDTAAQLPGCRPQTLEYPLFITKVNMRLVSGDPDSVVRSDGVAFVEEDDRIEFRLDVINRLEPACATVSQVDLSRIEARITYPLDPTLIDKPMGPTCAIATRKAHRSSKKIAPAAAANAAKSSRRFHTLAAVQRRANLDTSKGR